MSRSNESTSSDSSSNSSSSNGIDDRSSSSDRITISNSNAAPAAKVEEMKTRQQRLNEARAGRPPSPPQSLSYNQRGPKRTRAKPSATVAAGSVVPAAQSAVQGEAQSLLYVWVDFGPDASSRPVHDPTHKLTIPSSSIPTLLAFAETLRNQDKKSPRPAEEEHFPAMRPTGRHERGSGQAGVEGQAAERIIRSTSQTPEPTKNKRKRWGGEVDTPSPEVRSYGQGGRDSYGSPEEDEEREEQPGKIRRTREQEGFTSRVAGESNTARQKVGLKAQHTTMEYQGGNVLSEYYEAARNMANNGKQSIAKAPIPIADTTGRIKVSSPGHGDQSEKKNDEEVVTAGSRAVTPSHQINREVRSGSPAHRQSNLPEEEILRPREVAALRKLRDRVEKYKAALPGRRPSRA